MCRWVHSLRRDRSAIVVSKLCQAAAACAPTVGFEGVPDYYEAVSGERWRISSAPAYRDRREPAEALGAVGRCSTIDEPLPIIQRDLSRGAGDAAALTVALSGDGGDEVFGGYRKYQGELWAGAIARFPRRYATDHRTARALLPSKGNPLLERARRVRRFIAHAGGGGAARQAGCAPARRVEISDCLAGPNTPRLEAQIGDPWRSNDGDAINQCSMPTSPSACPATCSQNRSHEHGELGKCAAATRPPRGGSGAAAMPGAWKLNAARARPCAPRFRRCAARRGFRTAERLRIPIALLAQKSCARSSKPRSIRQR